MLFRSRALIEFFGADNRMIEHTLKVLRHAENIMALHPDSDPEIVIASALLHDVGIKIAEERHGRADGRLQEEYGPPVAEQLLASIGFPAEKTRKVAEIVGNHHSPSRYDYVELEILKQADEIVNSGRGG